MFAALFAARAGADVILLEKNEKTGKKLYITGKGRCNVTNDCDEQEFLDSVIHGEKFLRSAIYGFSPSDTMELFTEEGLNLVTERGNRVFPMSGKSSDVIRTVNKAMQTAGVRVMLSTEVKSVKKENDVFKIATNNGVFEADKVIVATGGMSYPSTGSTGDGYSIAASFGHKIVKPVPALAPLITVENVKPLEGLSLKNVTLSAYSGGKKLAEEFGEALFTSKGLSGPIALTLSSKINRAENVKLSLDLKPALDNEKLEARIMRDFAERQNQDLKNVTRALMPERLNTCVLKIARLDEGRKVNSVTKDERIRLVKAIKAVPFTLKSLAPFEEAVITSGGVDLKELTTSMESRLVSGLYFVGETADVDALTGGFNLQIAYSTGVAAARSAVNNDK